MRGLVFKGSAAMVWGPWTRKSSWRLYWDFGSSKMTLVPKVMKIMQIDVFDIGL